MKESLLKQLREFERDAKSLRTQIASVQTSQISRVAHRNAAERLANTWVEELRSPLEHRFRIAPADIADASECAKKLHQLSRPNNARASYLTVLNRILTRFQDRYVLPVQQTAIRVETTADLQKIVSLLSDPKESEYLQEAIECASRGCRRASCVMGWCAAVDRMRRKIEGIGFDAFNAASLKLKAQDSGKFKRWNKEFKVASVSDLQQVFDTDLIVVLEGMGLIDDNEAKRLEHCFTYRNNSAHPGNASIEEPNLVAFFSDIEKIIFSNPRFKL